MKTLHKKWLIWIGVTLMLIGMTVYILTLDESEPPSLTEPAPTTQIPE